MKKILILLLLIPEIISYSQELLVMGYPSSSINFEDTSEYKYVFTDTNNIWQIVEPKKQILCYTFN